MVGAVASVVLLTYNQAAFVQEAFESILNQDTDDIEIVVSDDCSSDSTWDVILAVAQSYVGPKKLILSRNASNLGIVDNYAAAVEQSTGELIFMAAGDDISMPDRCSKSIQFWLDNQKKYDLVAADAIDMAYAGEHLKMKETDRLEEWSVKRWFEGRPFFFGASFMVTRRLLILAPLNNQLPYEDQCLVFRSLLLGGAIRLPEPLVCHRRGGMTQSTRLEFGRKRLQIKLGMSLEILELQQFVSDAAIMNKRSEIEYLSNQRLLFCQVVRDLFQSPISINAAQIFWKNAPISTKLKCRYLRYYFFYPFLAVGHLIRDIIRRIKKSDRR